jgi:enterochelin esterase family protein
MIRRQLLLRLTLIVVAASLGRAAFAANPDDKLSTILIPGEDWQPVVTGLGFADGLSFDPAGNVYFANLRKGKDASSPAPGIYRLSPDGKTTKLSDAARSGSKPGPDGKTLYLCGGDRVATIPIDGGPETVLAEKTVKPNDLVVTKEGRIYITDTGRHQITLIDPQTKEPKPVDVGIKGPNGIGLSPDGKTLLVSDYNGVNVWTFTIQPDGSLADKKPAMTMKAPEKKPDVAGGDGMTTDTAGRAYVTTSLGVQIFAPTGELLGILPKPKETSLVSAGFGGEGLGYLYIACGDTIYRRKTQAKGLVGSLAGMK